MELHKLKILQRQSCTRNHSIAVTGARVRTRATKVRPSIPASCEHCFVRTEAMKGTIFHVKCNDTDALAILHDKIKRKVFDEKVGIVTQGLAVEGVKQRMTSTVSRSSTAIGLSALPVLE